MLTLNISYRADPYSLFLGFDSYDSSVWKLFFLEVTDNNPAYVLYFYRLSSSGSRLNKSIRNGHNISHYIKSNQGDIIINIEKYRNTNMKTWIKIQTPSWSLDESVMSEHIDLKYLKDFVDLLRQMPFKKKK